MPGGREAVDAGADDQGGGGGRRGHCAYRAIGMRDMHGRYGLAERQVKAPATRNFRHCRWVSRVGDGFRLPAGLSATRKGVGSEMAEISAVRGEAAGGRGGRRRTGAWLLLRQRQLLPPPAATGITALYEFVQRSLACAPAAGWERRRRIAGGRPTKGEDMAVAVDGGDPSATAVPLGGTVETVLASPRIAPAPATLEEARNAPGRARADRGDHSAGSRPRASSTCSSSRSRSPAG